MSETLLTILVGNGANLKDSSVDGKTNAGGTPLTCWINVNDIAVVQLSTLVCETVIELI